MAGGIPTWVRGSNVQYSSVVIDKGTKDFGIRKDNFWMLIEIIVNKRKRQLSCEFEDSIHVGQPVVLCGLGLVWLMR